jgi:hypothetical protein
MRLRGLFFLFVLPPRQTKSKARRMCRALLFVLEESNYKLFAWNALVSNGGGEGPEKGNLSTS